MPVSGTKPRSRRLTEIGAGSGSYEIRPICFLRNRRPLPPWIARGGGAAARRAPARTNHRQGRRRGYPRRDLPRLLHREVGVSRETGISGRFGAVTKGARPPYGSLPPRKGEAQAAFGRRL